MLIILRKKNEVARKYADPTQKKRNEKREYVV